MIAFPLLAPRANIVRCAMSRRIAKAMTPTTDVAGSGTAVTSWPLAIPAANAFRHTT